MKKLLIKKQGKEPLAIKKRLNNLMKPISVDILNWAEYPYTPTSKFKITHTGKEIILKFEVTEKYIRALETKTNGDVYKDSCVEFFISFDKKNYYNLEFNCIGTIHMAYGPARDGRKFIDPEILEKIEVTPSLGKQPFEEKTGLFNWSLLARIPVQCFVFEPIKQLSGIHASANFYKCGDETSEPHFLSWNPVHTNTPDFHRPEFFGQVEFE